MLLDVVYNHVGASGAQALEAFGPYFTDKYETFWGKAINFDDAGADGVREWVLQSAEGWIRDFHLDGLRLDAIHAIVDGGAVHIVQALTARVHGLAPRALVIAESGMNDPKVVRSHERGGWGCDARLGRRLPPRPARAAHRRPRRLLRGVRRDRAARQGLPPPARRTTATTRRSRGRRFGARADDVAARALRRLRPEPRPGRQPRVRRPPAARGAPARRAAARCSRRSRRCCSWARSTARPRRSSSSPTTSTRRSRSPRARAAGASSPASPSSPARRSPTRRTRETFRRSKLTRTGEPEGLRDLYARLLAARRAIGPGEAAADYDEHAGLAAGLRRGDHLVLANFARSPVHVPVDRPLELLLATHHATVEPGHVVLPAARRSAAAMTVDAVWPGQTFPLGATWDGSGTNFSLFTEHAERVELCLFDGDDDEQRDRADRAHRPHLALLPARRRPGPALRLPRPRPLRPRAGPPLQPGQAAARPVREVDRRPGALGRGQRPALRADRQRRTPTSSADDEDDVDAVPKSVVIDPRFDWEGDRRPDTPLHETVIYETHVQRLHAPAPRGPRGPARHLRRARLRARDRLPARRSA